VPIWLLLVEILEVLVVVGRVLCVLWNESVDGHLFGHLFYHPFAYHLDTYHPYADPCPCPYPCPCPFCLYPYRGLYRRRTSIYCWSFVLSAALAKETLVKNDEMVLPVY
jgi:hypothetical protein